MPPSSARGLPLRGDFQTPDELCEMVWGQVKEKSPTHIIEPTVGEGAFIRKAPAWAMRASWVGWEINPSYVRAARAEAKRRGVAARIHSKSFFDAPPLEGLADDPDVRVLVIGNPPWVTASSIGSSATQIDSSPTRSSTSLAKGLQALLGSSNFDLAEAVTLRALSLLPTEAPVEVALLVKRSVAIRLAKILWNEKAPVSDLRFTAIDCKRYFNADVDGGLFQLQRQPTAAIASPVLSFYPSFESPVESSTTIDQTGELVLDAKRWQRVRFLTADPALTQPVWRQGVKHDAASILELTELNGVLSNGAGANHIRVEREALHPLFKGGDVFHGRSASKLLPLYQRDLSGPDLSESPKLRRYLQKNKKAFVNRKSKIYRSKPDFYIFGVGDYTLAPYKVAISALHKEPTFRVLKPWEGKAPLTDDTVYFLSFSDRAQARLMHQYLTLEPVKELLLSLANSRSKRVWTKAVLSRVWLPSAEQLRSPLFAEISASASFKEQCQLLKKLRSE